MADLMIIGKNGQLGKELVSAANKLGFSVIAFGKEELDVRKYNQVKKEIERIKPKVVINTSTYQVVDECEKNPKIAFDVNTLGVRNIADICRNNKILTITYSTDYVFDGKKGEQYVEADRPNPLQIYGISKLAGELACLDYNFNSIIIRTCALFGGKYGSKKKGNFVINTIREVEGKKFYEVNCDQIINPTYANDLAEATLKLISKNATPGIYHLVNEGYCSWADFAQTIMKLKNINTEIIPIERKGIYGKIKRPLFTALSNTKAKKLGVTLPSWQSGLERYIKLYT